MRIAFTFNVKKEDDQGNINQEFDNPYVIQTIKKSLIQLGHTVIEIEANEDAFETLRANKTAIDLVFNIAEGLEGDARESQIPIYCELLKIPYTHSSPTTNAITLNKTYTKLMAKASGIRTPTFQLLRKPKSEHKMLLNYPVIVKPNSNGSSQGIYNDSVVENESELNKAIERLFNDYHDEVLVEEFIDGREFTVGVYGNNGDLTVLPIVEQRFDFMPEGSRKIAGYELKWIYEDKLQNLKDAYICPAPLSKKAQAEIEDMCKQICRVLEVKDIARLDFRMNDKEELFFIEINTLPGINPNENEISYLPVAAKAANMSYLDLIGTIIACAAKRYNLSL